MTTESPGFRTPKGPSGALAGLRWATVAALAVGVLSLLAAVAFSTAAAVLGAVLGTGLVLVFFGFGGLSLNVVAAQLPWASMIFALLTYTLEVALLGLVFWALTRSGLTDDQVDPTWLALTTIGATLGWLLGQIVGTVRTRQPIYDLDPRTGRGDVGQAGSVRGGGGTP